MKNLIFAAAGPKPEIVLADAVNNDLRIVRNEQFCLVYDRPLAAHGLTWAELTTWWSDRQGMAGLPEQQIWRSLYQRLDQSHAGAGCDVDSKFLTLAGEVVRADCPVDAARR